MNDDWCLAIRERRRVRVTYGGGSRLVEFHLYGKDQAGTDLVRAYQVGGHSSSGAPSGWKLFHADQITDWSVTTETFTSPRPGYKAEDPALVTIYCRL